MSECKIRAEVLQHNPKKGRWREARLMVSSTGTCCLMQKCCESEAASWAVEFLGLLVRGGPRIIIIIRQAPKRGNATKQSFAAVQVPTTVRIAASEKKAQIVTDARIEWRGAEACVIWKGRPEYDSRTLLTGAFRGG